MTGRTFFPVNFLNMPPIFLSMDLANVDSLSFLKF